MRLLGYNALLVLLLSTTISLEVRSESSTVRIQKNDQGQISSFDTAIIKLQNNEKEVDLIGAVHLADLEYYDKLNQLFEKYDHVLYELVAPEGHVATLDSKRKPSISETAQGNPAMASLALSQMMLTKALHFTYQLQGVNYKAENFVHADFTPEELFESMKDRGESFTSMILSLLAASVAQETSDPDAAKASSLRLLLSMISKNRVKNLRRSLAAELVKMEHLLTSLSGPKGSVLITERNRKALTVLDQVFQRGSKKVAIFYGAAHLPDFIEKLKTKGFKISNREWMTAWDLR